MFKFNDSPRFRGVGEGSIMNAYANQFMEWGINFRGRPTIQLMAAQTNRSGWLKAVKKKGIYDITALAEVNEAERASSRILSVFTDDVLKANNEALVQIIKSRFGAGMADPVSVFCEPQCYLFGSDSAPLLNQTPGTSEFDSLFFEEGMMN